MLQVKWSWYQQLRQKNLLDICTSQFRHRTTSTSVVSKNAGIWGGSQSVPRWNWKSFRYFRHADSIHFQRQPVHTFRWCSHELLLGPTYAHASLCYHEKEWLNQFPNEFRPTLYRIYVDDTFIFKNVSQVERFSFLNTKHPNL